jgi:hypothetical protein
MNLGEETLQRRVDLLLRFGEAWRCGDVDTLMSLMSDEPVYRGSTGALPGSEARGRQAVAAAFERMVGMNRGNPAPAPSPAPRPYFFENHALVYWRLTLSGTDGPVEVDGVDVITFDDEDRIVVKDAYRKAFT